MDYKTVFKRYEMKYLLTVEQKNRILECMQPFMQFDKYGRTTIRNLYFDTDTYLLIRRSIEKPEYKEKLRIRSYGTVNKDSTVFVELKKKYKKVVYKRRIGMTEEQALSWVCEGNHNFEPTQITKEIDYFLNFYDRLHPTVFLSYEREAYFSKDKSDFRVTFDDNILARTTDLSLESEVYGEKLLKDGYVLMEIKCSRGMPLWMAHFLSEKGIFKTSFSKYGTAYSKFILPLGIDKKEKTHA